MAFARKYYTEFGDKKGNAWEVRLLQDDFAGAAQAITADEPPCTLRYEGEGSFPYSNPIRGSQLTYSVIPEESGVEENILDIFEADEGEYRIELWKNGDLQWRGSVLAELSAEPFASGPRIYQITATDGLGRLKGIDFLDGAGDPYTGRVSMLWVINICLNKLGYLLPFATSDDWFSEAMTPGDPLAQADVDQAIFYDPDGNPFDCLKVLDAILRPKSLTVKQSAGRWWIVQQQQYAKNSFTLCFWNYDGSFDTSAVFDPRVTFDNMNLRIEKGSQIPRSNAVRDVKLAYQSRRYAPFLNGDMEKWDVDSGNIPINPKYWTVENGSVRRSAFAANGFYSCEFDPETSHYYNGPPPDYDSLTRIVQSALIEIDPLTGLRLKFHAAISGELHTAEEMGYAYDDQNWWKDFDLSPRSAYFCLRVGDYCYFALTIFNKTFNGWIESPIDLWNRVEFGANWTDFSCITNPIPQAGLMTLKLTQAVDDRKATGASAALLKCLRWDNVSVEFCWSPYESTEPPNDTQADDIEELTTIYEVNPTSSTVEEDIGSVYMGDGPNEQSLSRITVGGTKTEFWTRSDESDEMPLIELNLSDDPPRDVETEPDLPRQTPGRISSHINPSLSMVTTML